MRYKILPIGIAAEIFQKRRKQISLSRLRICAYVNVKKVIAVKTICVTIICKNESQTLPRLLQTVTFADSVVVVDTGSTDGTPTIAAKLGAKVFSFDWIDDFSAARNYAIKQADCDYVMWLDADDVVPAETANAVIAWKNSPSDADFVYMRYRFDGSQFWFWRERIVRNCKKCRFKGFIHEAIVPFGKTEKLFADVLHKPSASHEQRNYSIYQKRIASGKKLSAREKYYYARTLADCGKFEQAKSVFSRCAVDRRLYVVNRADCYLQLANMATSGGDVKAARDYLMRSVRLIPPDSQTACAVAYCYFAEGNYAYAKQWYVFATAARSDFGFQNDYFSRFLPFVQLSVCCYRLGERQEAKSWHQKAKAVAPDSPLILSNDKFFA